MEMTNISVTITIFMLFFLLVQYYAWYIVRLSSGVYSHPGSLFSEIVAEQKNVSTVLTSPQ